MHFNQLRTIQFHTNALAHNLSWEDEIVEDVVVDSGQGATAWTLLFVGIGATTTGLGQNFTFGAEDDVTAGELLLQFAHQTSLDLLEGLLFGNWNVNDDSLKSENE